MMKNRYEGTSTETLIRAMEDLGEAEENQVLVIIRNSEGNIGMITNLAYFTDRIGLLQAQLMWEQAGMVKTEINQ
jgi:hypothetical protein